MKNKLLKSTLLISLATPVVASISSCSTSTNVNNNLEATNNSSQLNGVTKVSVKFNKGTADRIEGPTSVKAKVGTTFGSIEQPIAYKDNRPQTYWVDGNGKKYTETTTIPNQTVTLTPYFEADIQLKNCLSVIALEHTMFNVTHFGTNAIEYSEQQTEGTKPDLLYSTDGFKWQEFTGTPLSIEPGSALYIRGNNPKGFSHSMANYSSFTMAGTVHLNGSVMSLIDNGTGTTAIDTDNTYCFARLFQGCSGIKVISSDFLPAKTISDHCYEGMFENCTNLEEFPNYLLKAETLTVGCYAEMFKNCTALKSIPTGLLSYAKTLGKECYMEMFRGCTALTSLPAETLPAKTVTLAEGCYEAMFKECTNIETISDDLLPATALQPYCYYNMFDSCSKLTDASGLKLSATELATGCYKSMFGNCITLTKGPTLGATTLADECYHSMFYNCVVLSEAPDLNATKMCKDCYAYMFYDCALITAAPDLESTELAEGCYKGMFYNCTGLTSGPTNLLARVYYPYCYEEMFYNCSKLTTPPTFPTSTTSETRVDLTTNNAIYCCNRMFMKAEKLTKSPVLTATSATVGCYAEMFSNCTALTSIGNISLTSLANYACYLMFISCSSVTIKTGGGTKFFTCPSTTGLTMPVRSMFESTKGASSGYAPNDNTTYYYS